MRIRRFLYALALSIPALHASSSAQEVKTLVEVGDEIFGIGNVTSIQALVISDTGEWLVQCDTDAPVAHDNVILRSGTPTLQEGVLLVDPPETTVKDVQELTINRFGNSGWRFSVTGLSTQFDGGVFFDSILLGQEGTVTPVPDFTPGTVYNTFNNAKINDQRKILAQVTVDDPNIPTGGDAALLMYHVDEDGIVEEIDLLAVEGQVLPPISAGISTITGSIHSTALNNVGDAMFHMLSTDGGAFDGNIYVVDSQGVYHQVAQDGRPSPVTGRNYSNLGSPELDLNDFGDVVFSVILSGESATNLIITAGNYKTGERRKHRQKGDTVAPIAPFKIQTFNSAPVFVSNAGGIFHYADWDDGNMERDQGIFLNDRLLIQEGVTMVDDIRIDEIRTISEAYHVSPSGQHIVFWARLDGGTVGAYSMDLGEVKVLPDCIGNEGTLRHGGGLPLIGEVLELSADDGQGSGVTPFLLVSDATTPSYPDCGVPVPYGEWVIDFFPPNPALILVGNPWSEGNPSTFFVTVPEDPSLLGASVFAQCLFFDIGDQIPEPPFRLTNALQISFSAP